ncbi:helix-turn-helix domain-containing protein [Paenibacillus sp. HB172176]|uniref:helix-turn-helix domain-containing protein n=1 Tax=Paenibacillus sp. HB172176 TaxID=2493690 RepID=UPI0014397337|nr:helix-turn-helix domain-containing protein [Paenibacillus sp. HB172176]
MKSRSWFNRWLFTYLPIFYLVVGFLIFLFFMTISQVLERQMLNTNENYTKYVTQQMESSLQNIEQLMIGEINNNKDVKRFLYELNDEEDDNPYLIERRLSEKFNTFKIDFPLIDSIYMVRISDLKVLSTSASLPLESFGDKVFVEQLQAGDISYEWTGSRPYQLFFSSQTSYPVVSLVKKIPLLADPSGFLVVNVSTSAIKKMVQDMNTLNVSYTTIYDQEGHTIVEADDDGSDVVSHIHSDYTSWEVNNGIKGKFNYGIVTNLYYGWLTLGIFSILFGTVIIIYLSRRYTSPIDSMMSGISQYIKSKSDELPDILNDNPRFMDKAVNHLIELANQYSDVNKENVLHRRKQLFLEMISGELGMDAELSELPNALHANLSDCPMFLMGIIEIDKYSEFCSAYSSGDQYLIKYVMSNVMEEIAESSDVHLWAEWLDNGRLTVLFHLSGEQEIPNRRMSEICDKIRLWIKDNLDYSVSIGLGSAVREWKDISQSFNEAEEALSYKASVGGNRVIPYWELEGNVLDGMFEQLQLIRDIAELFKHRNTAWKDSFNQLMEVVQGKYYLLQDITNLLNFMIFQISKEMSELPASYQGIWECTAAELNRELKAFDSIDAIRDSFMIHLGSATEQMERLRIGRNSQELIHETREYIDQHYSDPDLSLQSLSHQFQINQSYLSRLFKDEFSENFVDYLTRIRISQAKHLLTTTNDLIQDISLQVGYLHYFSFNRVFKKVVGVTPGEYRKQSGEKG